MVVTNGKGAPGRKTRARKLPKTAKKAAETVKTAATVEPPATPKPTGKLFRPTNDQRQIVMLAAAHGMPEDRIRLLIINPDTQKPVNRRTLRDTFPHELKNGRELILMKIAGTLISVATDKGHKGCVPAAIWLQKTWGRMREPEPEWAEKRREEEKGKVDAGSGWTIIRAAPVLEEPKEPKQLPPPTLQ